NVQSEFFRNHPEFHEAQESGTPQAKLCLAHEAVRRHKIDILIEAAAYGLDGLCLGFLRHPPILHYAPILVEGYTKTYGEPPPSDEASKDPHFIQSLPIMDETHQQWYR
ncbi:MAG TPA: hypothetical protein DIT99_00115, partial [Candidatus Latescibacteria bacterium]|nr:hypothetical protein [Candidatus Latescibacterota bacterium]